MYTYMHTYTYGCTLSLYTRSPHPSLHLFLFILCVFKYILSYVPNIHTSISIDANIRICVFPYTFSSSSSFTVAVPPFP